MDVSKLKQFFNLENNEDLFKLAITPKSCGGGENFKLLALLGDRVLNLELFEILSLEGIEESGTMTIRINNYIHNEDILSKVGRILKIDTFMNPMDFKHKITKNELKESVEALIGANYKAHGYGIHKEVIKKLYKIIQKIMKKLQEHRYTQLFTENPKGKLLELFQKYSFPLPIFDTQRVGGTDNLPMLKCLLKGKFFDKQIELESDILNNKTDAEKDVAVKFLMKLENETEFDEKMKIKKETEKIIYFSNQSLKQDELLFSKKSIQGDYFKPEEVRLSTGTGETLYEWATRKSDKKPFSTLLLLTARLNSINGSSWHLSISNGELILLNMRLNKQDYFEVGFADSKNKAKKEAAKKFIRNSNLMRWLKDNYGDELI